MSHDKEHAQIKTGAQKKSNKEEGSKENFALLSEERSHPIDQISPSLEPVLRSNMIIKSSEEEVLQAVRNRDLARLRWVLDSGVVLRSNSISSKYLRCNLACDRCLNNRLELLHRKHKTKSRFVTEVDDNSNVNYDVCSSCLSCNPLLLAARSPGYLAGQEMAILLIRYGASADYEAAPRLLEWAARGGHEDLV